MRDHFIKGVFPRHEGDGKANIAGGTVVIMAQAKALWVASRKAPEANGQACSRVLPTQPDACNNAANLNFSHDRIGDSRQGNAR